MFREKIVEKTKMHISCSVTFLFENPAFYENVENYCTAGQATCDNMVLHAECLRLETDTQNM
jgi:hypothetical protein